MMLSMKLHSFLILIVLAICAQASAQKLPPPTRELYRCEESGKVVYSDSPCLGAKRVDVQPTRGVNKTTGTERTGADVRSERHNEAMAQALYPIFGETSGQREKRHRRASLSKADKSACGQLDGDISGAEKRERTATGEQLQTIQIQLFQLRKEYKNLRC